ncbi:MAG: stage II sporulation protein P [Clostridia bacterium]|nr:stage II sporulation protein P [Clostridia bacterium]
MVNFRVIRINDLFKFLGKFLVFCFVVAGVLRGAKVVKNLNIKNDVKNRFDKLNNKTFLECLDENIGVTVKKKEQDENIISKELGFLDSFNISEGVEYGIESDLEVSGEETKESVKDIRNVTTEIVSENNKEDVFTNSYGNVQIKNETSFDLTEDMIVPNIDFNNKKDIVIFHTHTCESYTPSEKYNYVQTGNYRTTDLDYSVARVGTELANILTSKGYNVAHDVTYHDYPEYTGSYTRSLETAKEVVETTPAELVIDLHRDAMGDCTYGPKIKIGDEYAAQLMFVMGSSEGGLYHPNWNENLKLAVKIQEKAEEMYPGLFKPIMLTQYRYNQSVARGSCIIEVGATGNTLDEALNSMKYLAEVIDEVMK